MEAVRRFLDISYGSGSGYGYGYGYGDGSGSGDGDGSGYGSGDGSGSGYGSGDGYGYGYGDGYGYGYGYGDGDGSGSGYGDGYGYGDGDGIAAVAGQTVYRVDGVQTLIYHARGSIAKGAILNSDLTLTPCYIVKNGNLFAHGETLQEAQEALRDKIFEDMPEDERIDAFLDEIKPGTIYPARVFFDWHNRLTGSCEMGRKAFAADHGIDIDSDTMTVEQFAELTQNAYGGEVIQRVKERLVK